MTGCRQEAGRDGPLLKRMDSCHRLFIFYYAQSMKGLAPRDCVPECLPSSAGRGSASGRRGLSVNRHIQSAPCCGVQSLILLCLLLCFRGKKLDPVKSHHMSPSWVRSSDVRCRPSSFIPRLNIYPPCALLLCPVGSPG